MTERCPECLRAVGLAGGECPARLMGAVDADHDACAQAVIAMLRTRLLVADRLAEAARNVKVSIETGRQQALAGELLGALLEYDSAALLRRTN